ncbi:MAG: hypothetical protein ABJC12_09245 [Saprospiraceae bacterium]
MLKQSIYNTYNSSPKEIEYEVYDLTRDVIHRIDQDMEYRVSMKLDTIHKYEIELKGIERNQPKLISKTVHRQQFEEYQCLVEKKEMEKSSYFDQPHIAKYNSYRYYAKIKWLDSILNTRDKLAFVGFYNQEYSPYNYLLFENIEDTDRNPQILTTVKIKKGLEDTSLIIKLLSLPAGKDRSGVLRDD